MNFKSVFEQVQADVLGKVEQVRADALNPERLAKAQQSVEALSGLVEVARENVENLLNDVQNGLILLSENIAEANAEAVDETVKRETPNDWDKFFSKVWDEAQTENVTDEAKAEKTAYTQKPDSSWTNQQKVEWLIGEDENWSQVWTGEDTNIVSQGEDMIPQELLDLRNNIIDEEIDRVWREKYEG